MDESNLKKIRLEKLEKLRAKGINPYPAYFHRVNTIAESLKKENEPVKTAGRIFSFRTHGNIAFADIKDESGKIQLFFQKKLLGDKFNELKNLDIGDFIGVEGTVSRTVAGEISIIPTEITLLSKALLPLPNDWFGLKDTETRYRQRYLDFLINPEIRERFNTRTKVISGIREYLDNLGFWEVETPTLQPLYGGANAKPFITHLRALDQDMYLRIADELYLKRLIAGGYEKVYEIAKDFRNEGIDHTHFPEFTMIEWYESYADYQVMMDRAEGLLKHLSQKIFGSTLIKVGEKIIDIGKKWPRIEMTQILKDKLDLNVENMTKEELYRYAKEHFKEIQLLGGETKGQLIFAIFEHAIPQLLDEPTWIVDYPKEVSPLSKAHRNKEGWVERFEGYVGGKEIFDGWSELNDPQIQRATWVADTNATRKDKEEAQHVDEDFLIAMEHGMPPFGGIGVGIDRLTMLFTNTWIIKEVILFPTLKRDILENKELISLPTQEKTSIHKPSTDQDFSKKIVIVVNEDLPLWQILNTVGHISAYLGNKMDVPFDTGRSFDSKDNVPHPRNTQYPIIILSAKKDQLQNITTKARNYGLLYHGFIREMIETTNDNEIEKVIANKSEDNIEYLGVGIFGDIEEIEKLTENFRLWKGNTNTTIVNADTSTMSHSSMTREKAYTLLTTHLQNKNLIKHCLAAEAAMKGIYKHLHKDDYNTQTEEIWGITGLLHDVDYEIAQKENMLNKHGILLFEKDPNIIPEPMAHAIKSHNFTMTGVQPESDLDWAITCVDGLTGLVVSSALIHPDKKLASIDSAFVLKRFNTPSFSKNVDRQVIKMCEEKLGIPLDQFIGITLSAMQGIASEMGL